MKGYNQKKLNDDLVAITDRELRGLLKNSNAVLATHHNARKYSEIMHDFLGPAINEVIDDEKAIKFLLNFGTFIWNKAVAEECPDHPKSKDMEAAFPRFRANFEDQSLINEFLDRKKKLFGNEYFFVVTYTYCLGSGGSLAISVAADQV
jgi:hypothetical protein